MTDSNLGAHACRKSGRDADDILHDELRFGNARVLHTFDDGSKNPHLPIMDTLMVVESIDRAGMRWLEGFRISKFYRGRFLHWLTVDRWRNRFQEIGGIRVWDGLENYLGAENALLMFDVIKPGAKSWDKEMWSDEALRLITEYRASVDILPSSP